MPRALCWPYGGGAVSYERGTPVHGVVSPEGDMSVNVVDVVGELLEPLALPELQGYLAHKKEPPPL